MLTGKLQTQLFLQGQGGAVTGFHLAKGRKSLGKRAADEIALQLRSVSQAPEGGENVQKSHAALQMLADKTHGSAVLISQKQIVKANDL